MRPAVGCARSTVQEIGKRSECVQKRSRTSCHQLFLILLYSHSNRFRVYSDRIETNAPQCRFFGMLGCGSWNADAVRYHPFDRGAFGFRLVPAPIAAYFCGIWPIYGWSIARQRCQCNGPLWHGGWWCDEWLCALSFCSFRYSGMVNADETAFAASIALQAYFEGRVITKADMDKCIEYWQNNISEQTDPVGRKRDVCCEPFECPIPTGQRLYGCCHQARLVPFRDDDDRNTEEIRAVRTRYFRQLFSLDFELTKLVSTDLS